MLVMRMYIPSSYLDDPVFIDPTKLDGERIVVGGENQMLTLLQVEHNALVPKVNIPHSRSNTPS